MSHLAATSELAEPPSLVSLIERARGPEVGSGSGAPATVTNDFEHCLNTAIRF